MPPLPHFVPSPDEGVGIKVTSNLHPIEVSGFTLTLNKGKDSSMLCSEVVVGMVMTMTMMTMTTMMMMAANAYLVSHG